MKTTGFSRVSKDLIIAEVEKEVKNRSVFFVARHDTVPAASMDKLRAKLRLSGSRYLVVKKSLGKKAFERALELLSLTKDSQKEKSKLKEVSRVYELLVDYFAGENLFKSTDELWRKYFNYYTYISAKNRSN